MNNSLLEAENNQPGFKVSISTRLITALFYIIPLIGGALSSILLMRVFRAMAVAESAGIGAVMAGMKEAAVPTIVALYLAAGGGMVVIVVLVIRMIVETKTASPPSWFFVLGGLLCLLPAGFFWKAQLLILDVLSPASSIGAGGVASVGSDISRWLMLSLIAVPVVFIILIGASLLPLSSRSRSKWLSLIAATAIGILLITLAITIPFLINEPKRRKELVNLPVNVKYAEIDRDIEKETSVILTLTSDNKLYSEQKQIVSEKVERTETVITKEELPEKLKSLMRDKTPDRRIVYFKADVNASYENVLQIFDLIRKVEVSKVGLLAVGEKKESNPYQLYNVCLAVELEKPKDEEKIILRPNPLLLVAMLKKDGKLALNLEDLGMISDPTKLENRLIEVFKEREENGVFREGTNEIEKTVFLMVSKISNYGDFIKLVEAVKGARAEPIGIKIDDLNLRDVKGNW